MWKSGVSIIIIVITISLLDASETRRWWQRRGKKPKEIVVLKETDQLIEAIGGYRTDNYDLKIDIKMPNYEKRQKKELEKKRYEKNGNDYVKKFSLKLRIFRIRNIDKLNEKKLPVLLMHGASGSSSDFVFGGKEESLGAYLADQGYDVWLGNLRGNKYAGLRWEGPDEFWDHSFHEMGLYDIPEQIDFILAETKKKKIFYIGFSMGATAAYVMLSSRAEYNSKIARMVSMAPVVMLDWKNADLKQKLLLLLHWEGDLVSKILRVRQLTHWNMPFPGLKKPKCFKKRYHPLCEIAMGSLTSRHKSVYNKELKKKFLKEVPVGVSSKTIMHYFQVAESTKFRPYSYYREKNIDKYGGNGTVLPYPLENVKVPILFLLAEDDTLVDEIDIRRLREKMRNLEDNKIQMKYVENFMHLDFFVGKELQERVFEPILTYLEHQDYDYD